MTMQNETMPAQETKGLSGAQWALALLPLLALAALLVFLGMTGGGLNALSGPPVEQVTIQRITLPERGRIEVRVVNDGAQPVTIPQVLVDDAYWDFVASPSTTIPRLGQATFTIYYPWVRGEMHEIKLLTEIGGTFTGEIPVAVETPAPSLSLFGRFGLVGLYVGVLPVLLGMLWYPLMRRLSTQAMNFILSLTIGLLVFLAVGTWLDALEFAADLPAFWQGVPLVAFVGLLSLAALLAIGSRRDGRTRQPLALAYLIALGIGLHNLGEGLAIGAAFSIGQAALGTFLVLGFTLHNITEGIGIAAPVTNKNPGIKHFALLILLAGGPAIIGTWVGSFAFDAVLATVFLAVGVGAILQVVWEVGKLVAERSERLGVPVINWVNLAGLLIGIAIMYFTAFMVKF